MHTFETSATVEAPGEIHVAGVPFAPGTEVEVTISPKARSEQDATHAPSGLHWEGNVLVHQGIGASPSAAQLRDERLSRLGEGRSG